MFFADFENLNAQNLHKSNIFILSFVSIQNMSLNGVYDKKAQIKSLGSRYLYNINQGEIEKGAQSLSTNCIASLANHVTEVKPYIIEL